MSHHNSPHHYHHRSSHHHQSDHHHRSSYQHRSSSSHLHENAPRITDESSRSRLNDNEHEFHIHSNNYNLVFIDEEISTNTLTDLVIHVNKCRQYSIDTESDKRDKRLALIQVHTMPVEDKPYVLLFQLHHLPNRSSVKYEKILELFELMFRSDNKIYSWGNRR